jgi:hypothetical protein
MVGAPQVTVVAILPEASELNVSVGAAQVVAADDTEGRTADAAEVIMVNRTIKSRERTITTS